MSVLDLLEYNKLRSAEREIEQEKAAREQSAPAKEHDLRLQRKRRTSAMER